MVCLVRQILEISSIGQLEETHWQNKDQLIVVEFYVSGTPDCNSSVEEFEALNSKYGIEKQALFVRINFELEPACKEIYDVDVFPSYKLFWNNETLCEISGMDKENLEKAIVENLRGPAAERVADRGSDDYFDPR
ncbi:thioredoxin 1 [Paramuricea clavata]|uniref:Thioredoxin 1 n=1 Tax=Paramuricea clavata TaxID=317549 RepID=A0A6S7ISD3_PARCT|nr:thioredoxin 1 [Paramuricea clavata]